MVNAALRSAYGRRSCERKKPLWGDGSLQSITDIIRCGLPQPKQHPGAMPPFGGVPLSESDLAALAAYVWAIGHQKE